MAQKTIRKELKVAFSKHSQPIWFRIVKYLAFAVLIYFCWNTRYFWWIMLTLFILAMILHFFYRYKTKGWTRSYGGWDYEKVLGKKEKDIKE